MAHQLPFTLSIASSIKPLDLVWADVWDLAPIVSRNGFKYYLSIVDHFARFTRCFPLKNKSDVLSAFTSFIIFVERFFNTKIISLQTYAGGEFLALTTLCKNLGINHRFSCPHTHQQNGIVERKHRHIVEIGLTLLAQASLPFSFWANAFETATYLINLLPTPILQNRSPYFMVYHKPPDYFFLKIFGCECWPNL